MPRIHGQSGNKPRLDVSISESPRDDNILQILITEYNSLRTEIQYRSEYQNRLLQLHIATLTIILGTALSPLVQSIVGTDLSQLIGPMVILLIPIEASILGLWYLDHEITIFEIGGYIQVFIESKVAEVLQESQVMRWEAGWRVGVTTSRVRRDIRYRELVILTFAGPAIIVQIIVLFFLLLSDTWIRSILESFHGTSEPSWLLSLTDGLVQLPVLYSGSVWWLVALVWVIALVLIIAYLRLQAFRAEVARIRDDVAFTSRRRVWLSK